MKSFTINEKEYKARIFDFNLICDLEDMGITLQAAAEKPMGLVRAYFALCAGKGKDYVGKEMEQHLIKGGSFDDIMNVMTEEMNNSDFFQALNKTKETTA